MSGDSFMLRQVGVQKLFEDNQARLGLTWLAGRQGGNKVLTVVLHASLDGSHTVVSTALTHYSLSRLYSQTTGASPLRKAAAAPDMAEAFGLTVGPTTQ